MMPKAVDSLDLQNGVCVCPRCGRVLLSFDVCNNCMQSPCSCRTQRWFCNAPGCGFEETVESRP